MQRWCCRGPRGPHSALAASGQEVPHSELGLPQVCWAGGQAVLVSPKPADRLSWEEKQGHGDFGSSFSQLLSPGVSVFIHKLEMKGSSQGRAEMK